MTSLIIVSYSTVGFAFAVDEDFELTYNVFYNPLTILVDDKLVFLTEDKNNSDIAKSISVVDTKTGSLLYKIEHPFGDVSDEWFGKHIASFGSNIAASSSFIDPDTDKWITMVHVFDGNTGELLYTIDNPVPESMFFGYTLTSIGNNLAVYASDKDPNDDKYDNVVHVFGNSGSLLYTIENPDEYGDFGRHLATINDKILVNVLDRDNGEDLPEVIYAFEGKTGELLYTIEYPKQTTPHPDESYGRSTVISGNNIVVRSDNQVHIFDGDTGKLRHTVDHPVTTNSELQMILDSLDDDTIDNSLLILISGIVSGAIAFGIIVFMRRKQAKQMQLQSTRI